MEDHARIEGILQDLSEKGLENLFGSKETRDLLRATLLEWGCPKPLDLVIARSFQIGLSAALRAGGSAGRDILVARAMRWNLFRRLVEHVGHLAALHNDRAALKQSLRAALSEDCTRVTLEPDALCDLDILSVLRAERNAERLEAAFGEGKEELATLLADLPVRLNEPTVYDPSAAYPHDMVCQSPIRRLYFGATIDTLAAREDELHFLRSFLESHTTRHAESAKHAFRWQLVYGEGGLGKSRLALELLRRNAAVWRGGFVDLAGSAEITLSLWRPAAPTLFIVDYASREPRAVARLLRQLASTASEFTWPVRVLLLDRSAEEEGWLGEMFGTVGGQMLEGTMYAPPFRPRCYRLRVGDKWRETSLPFDATARLIRGRLSPNDAAKADAGALVSALLEIDPIGRPLFAAVVGEEIAAGSAPSSVDRNKIIRGLLTREEQRFWRADGESPTDEAHVRHQNLLTVSTLSRSASFANLANRAEALLPIFGSPGAKAFDCDRFERMSGFRADTYQDKLAPLEPDLFGELFVLDRLRALGPAATVLIDAAAEINRAAVSEFFARAAYDYPDDLVASDPIRFLKAGSAETALAIAVAMRSVVMGLSEAGRLEDALTVITAADQLAAMPGREHLRGPLSVARTNLIYWLSLVRHPERFTVLSHCRKAILAADAEEAEWAVKAYPNFTYGCSYSETPEAAEEALVAAEELRNHMDPARLDHMREYAKCWENAAISVMGSGALDHALSLIEARVAALSGEKQEVQEIWSACLASAAFNGTSLALEREHWDDVTAFRRKLEHLYAQYPFESVRVEYLKTLFNIFDRHVDGGALSEAETSRKVMEGLLKETAFDWSLRLKTTIILFEARDQALEATTINAEHAFNAHRDLLLDELRQGRLQLFEYRCKALGDIVTRYNVRREAWQTLKDELGRDGLSLTTHRA